MPALRNRLILEVVIMVLRGAQFQRSGPAGCEFLTRRVPPSYCAVCVHGWFVARCLPHGIRFQAENRTGNLIKDSRCMAREGDLCHGHIGELSSAFQPWL